LPTRKIFIPHLRNLFAVPFKHYKYSHLRPQIFLMTFKFAHQTTLDEPHYRTFQILANPLQEFVLLLVQFIQHNKLLEITIAKFYGHKHFRAVLCTFHGFHIHSGLVLGGSRYVFFHFNRILCFFRVQLQVFLAYNQLPQGKKYQG
jgi:hypothetical protein